MKVRFGGSGREEGKGRRKEREERGRKEVGSTGKTKEVKANVEDTKQSSWYRWVTTAKKRSAPLQYRRG